jgi:hypothetical protein
MNVHLNNEKYTMILITRNICRPNVGRIRLRNTLAKAFKKGLKLKLKSAYNGGLMLVNDLMLTCFQEFSLHLN